MPTINYALDTLGATATATHFTTGYPAEAAIDGSDVSKWMYDYGGSSVVGSLTIDLGAPQYIETIRTLLASPAAMSIGLQYSVDGINWLVLVARVSRNNGEYFDETGGITARYWRAECGSSFSGAFSISSMECLGPSEAPPPPANPNCTNMGLWLDGLEAYWVPCVQAWLEEN